MTIFPCSPCLFSSLISAGIKRQGHNKKCNSYQFVVLDYVEYFAAELVGWISGFGPVPIEIAFPQGRIDHIAAQIKSELIIEIGFWDAALQKELAVPMLPRPEDNALMIFTSVSTRVPSGTG